MGGPTLHPRSSFLSGHGMWACQATIFWGCRNGTKCMRYFDQKKKTTCHKKTVNSAKCKSFWNVYRQESTIFLWNSCKERKCCFVLFGRGSLACIQQQGAIVIANFLSFFFLAPCFYLTSRLARTVKLLCNLTLAVLSPSGFKPNFQLKFWWV